MTSDAEFFAEQLGQLSPTKLRRGRFVGLNGDRLALVDMGDSRFPCLFGTGYIPPVNEVVQVLSIGSQHLLLPLGARPKVGTVQTVSAPYATVQTLIGSVTAAYAGTAPTSGQRVLLEWTEDGPVVLSGALSVTPGTIDPDPDSTPPAKVRTVVFRAVQAGTTNYGGSASYWTPTVQAGNGNYGFWFYGSAIKDTIPAGATLVSLQFKVNRTKDFGGDPRFVLHNAPYATPTMPTVSGYTEWDPPQGWQTPPMAATWFAALKQGGSYYGVGLNQGGYNVFASLAQDSESGALRISWR